MPINFDQPQTTTSYASVLSYVRDHVSALSKLLEGETLSGTVPTGAKRYNAGTTFFERWNGSSWVEMPLGYLKLSGGTLTGALSGTSASFSGTVSGTFSGTFSGNGSAITNLNASNLASGTVPTARLGSGTASSSTLLRGDGVWANTLNGQFYLSDNTSIYIRQIIANQATNEKVWAVGASGTTFTVEANNDAINDGQPFFRAYRSGFAITGWDFYVNFTQVLSANSNRQVTIGAPASGSHTINGNVSFSGTISGNGSGITSLNADNLASGTIPGARFPATLPAVSGANLTNLNASSLTSGTVAPARLGSGSPSSSAFLRGDGTWTNTLSGDYLIVSRNDYSGLFIHTANESANQKYWSWLTVGAQLDLRAVNDGRTDSQIAMSFYRTGYSVTGWSFSVNGISVISANSNRQVTISAPASGAHSINGKTTYTPSDGPSNVEIGFRNIPMTTNTTLNTAKVGQCIVTSSSLTIPANVFSSGDVITIYNNSAGTITLSQGSGLTLRLAGSSHSGTTYVLNAGFVTIWFYSPTFAIVSGTGASASDGGGGGGG